MNKVGDLGLKSQLLMLALSVYVLFSLAITTFFTLPSRVEILISKIDFFLCIIFLTEFFINLFLAKSKVDFLKFGWIDLISSIPEIEILRMARVARVIRILRLLRGVKSTKNILGFLLQNRAQGTFFIVSSISIVLVLFSAIGILLVETSPQSNITSPEDALWWAFVTITTVGYGDLFPVTIEGRIVASILMTAGVGLFGTFTAFIASYFIEKTESNEVNVQLSKEEKDEYILHLEREMELIKSKLDLLLEKKSSE